MLEATHNMGPVTHAIAAMRNDPDPPRRSVLAGVGAALASLIVGVPTIRAHGLDLSFVAEEWLREARALGMCLIRQPDGSIWRSMPVFGGTERIQAREALWVSLQNRPRLRGAVYAAVERGFQP